MMETWIDSRYRYRGRVFALRVGHVRLDDGVVAVREVIEHPGGVAIVPVMGERVLLASQFRIAIGRDIVELPGGRLEKGELPIDCARREVEEEMGYRAGKMVEVSTYFTSAGYTNERMYLFLALDLQPTAGSPEFDERIQPVEKTLAEVEQMLERHEFEDARTIIGLNELLRYLAKERLNLSGL